MEDARARCMASVLIVDPEKNLRVLLEAYVRELGYAVEATSDGMAVLDRLIGNEFDVVLSDVRVATANDARFLREIRRGSPATAVVLTTGWDTVPSAVEAVRVGARDYLIKPFFSVEQVGALISQTLRFVAADRASYETA